MAGSVNKVILIGNVGKDPEIRSMQSGDKVANLSIATSESWKDKATGERKEKTEWHRVSIFNQNIVGVVERYVKKGAKLYIEGALETRKWTDQASGQDKYSTEVVIKNFNGALTMLDSKGGGGGSNDSSSLGEGSQASYDNGPSQSSSSSSNRKKVDELEDEIPF